MKDKTWKIYVDYGDMYRTPRGQFRYTLWLLCHRYVIIRSKSAGSSPYGQRKVMVWSLGKRWQRPWGQRGLWHWQW